MKRYRIRRMAERLALKITRDLPQDRFEQELWNLAAIIEEHLFSELAQLGEAESRTEETEPLLINQKRSVKSVNKSWQFGLAFDLMKYTRKGSCLLSSFRPPPPRAPLRTGGIISLSARGGFAVAGTPRWLAPKPAGRYTAVPAAHPSKPGTFFAACCLEA
jgi:hypothetical protein